MIRVRVLSNFLISDRKVQTFDLEYKLRGVVPIRGIFRVLVKGSFLSRGLFSKIEVTF